MRGKKLWAQFWTDRQKSPKRNNCIEGLNFLSSYSMTMSENVLKDLQQGLRMSIAEKWGSGYVVIFPNTPREELIRARLATHPFKTSEWPEHEIDGLPNRRYSIFIYDEQTCPQFAKLAETDWRMEYSEGIPIYEKGFNAAFLKRTFPKLIRILKSIYQGGTPQPTVLKTITTESNTRKDMKQNRIKLTESQLRNIIAESVKSVLNEIGDTNRGQYMLGRVARRALDGGRFDTLHAAKDRKNPNDTEAFYSGYDDEKQTDSYRNRRIQNNYQVYKTKDMDNIGRKFIDFIEHYQGGVLMQTIIDYESGNQTGTPSSPLRELIPIFEEEVLGYDCSNDVRKAIETAYNQWWYYAESQLMPEEDY